ncbi:hypothetical protein B0H67DRAFT_557614 [Lasiosphaeris hirsuta]|uniref:Uncharacterized protein n=1 Tax=Lasiosphaeris hirsuta TaxID=260670 RepID=A0AA40DM58_9PEZI|nr:hypothetical protein B0H67DRAFT_557614 [Lasiosphaeris hirsuta]
MPLLRQWFESFIPSARQDNLGRENEGGAVAQAGSVSADDSNSEKGYHESQHPGTRPQTTVIQPTFVQSTIVAPSPTNSRVVIRGNANNALVCTDLEIEGVILFEGPNPSAQAHNKGQEPCNRYYEGYAQPAEMQVEGNATKSVFCPGKVKATALTFKFVD